MSDRLSPGPEAKARLQALGEKEFHAFFEEIPSPAMSKIARFLPRVDGFRNTSPAGLVRQKSALARKLSKPNPDDRDFYGLYLIWRTWIDANFESPKSIHEMIDKLEAAVDESTDADKRRITIERHVDAFLERMRDDSRQNHCTREQIERLFAFSPFPETSAARGIISSAKGAADVDRDATLSELPKRLQRDEDEIERLKLELTILSDRLDPAVRSLAQFDDRFAAFEAGLSGARQSVEEATGTLTTHAEAIKKIEQQAPTPAGDDHAKVGMRIEGLTNALEATRGDVQALKTKLQSVDTVLGAVAEIAEKQKAAEENIQSIKGQFDALRSSIANVERDIATLREKTATADHLASVTERLDGLEQRPVATVTKSPSYETEGLAAAAPPEDHRRAPGLRWDRLCSPSEGSIELLKSAAEIANALSEALQNIGLKKTAAKTLGEECAAAILAKQAVFLKGGFAVATARAMARAVSGDASARISMPVGLLDGEALRSAVEAALGNTNGHVAALVVEGINRTAIDVYTEVLWDCLNPNSGGRIAVFGALSRGYASLTVDAGYFELGPIFDLDCLDWRSSHAPGGYKLSAISTDADKSLFSQISDAKIDANEAVRLASTFVPHRNPSIERAFHRAYCTLQFVRTDVNLVTALQSFYFGWLIPYWQVFGVGKDQIETEFDGGKVNGSAVDPRLNALIKNYGE